MNGTDFFFRKTGERLAEIGELLARGLTRLHNRQSSAFVAESGETSLHFTPDQSGHANPVSPEVNA
jgi:hypothetical protein